MMTDEYKNRGRYEKHFKYLRETKLYLPPLALQKKFAAFARERDEKKRAAREQKNALQKEREELVAKYFR